MSGYREIIERLAREHWAPAEELKRLIVGADDGVRDYAAGLAREVAVGVFHREVYVRGLVEISSRCMCGCYYCGLRAENHSLERYSLTEEEIVAACRRGYELGLRSFVLQGGQMHNLCESVAEVVKSIKREMPEVALTLSLGEQSEDTYATWRRAGADRYLLRHETASREHYERLHPEWMSYEGRIECLERLHRLGYQRGAGFMVGTPWQSARELAGEIEFLGRMQPEMVGIGPFIPQSATPFGQMPRGSVESTLLMISLVRLALPKALMPATTALSSSSEDGLVRGVLAGANVVMPNITPERYHQGYAIYDGKKSECKASDEGFEMLAERLHKVGYEATLSRGDHPDYRIDK